MSNPQEILTRTLEIQQSAILDESSRLVRLSFSSEEPVTRQSLFGDPWIEVLGHDDGEADLSRLNSAAPVLYNHDRSERENRIGVVERAWIEKGRGYAEIRLSRRPEVEGVWQDVREGILRNVSVAYRINERKLTEETENSPDLYRVTSWTPMEISLVDIPADASVGIGRKLEAENRSHSQPPLKENIMTDKAIEQAERSQAADTDALTREAEKKGAQRALELEGKRRGDIRELFTSFKDQEQLRDQCLDNPAISVDEARKQLLAALAAGTTPVTESQRVEVGETEVEKFARAAEDAVAVRAGIEKDSKKGTELCGYTLLELARKSLEVRGVRVQGMDKRELVGRAFTHSTSDFPKILENNARKAMLRGYDEAEETFDSFTRSGNLSDFKPHTRVGMGVFESLEKIPEGGEYKHGTIGERYETIQLATYGKLFSITRQAIINDDLNAFTDIPRKMGRAAARTVGDLVWSILTANPTLSDGVALFHSTHKNLAASGAALSAASVGAARTAMRTQKDGKATLNIRPRFLVVPAALEDTARVLMASETDPASANSRVPNPVRGALEIVVDARLDAVSTTAWYLAADPSAFDTIEVGYLDGVSTPFLDQQDGWTVDGVEYKVRMDAAAAPLEFRTLYKNPGA
jgi:hypothetical protein